MKIHTYSAIKHHFLTLCLTNIIGILGKIIQKWKMCCLAPISIQNSHLMENYCVEIWNCHTKINLEISFLLCYHNLVYCNFSYTVHSTAKVKVQYMYFTSVWTTALVISNTNVSGFAIAYIHIPGTDRKLDLYTRGSIKYSGPTLCFWQPG
jgi:hypothetical protein